MCVSVLDKVNRMVGGIIIAALLLLVFPVAIIMSGGLLGAMISGVMKMSVDNQNAGTEALKLSRSNPYR